MKKLKLLLALTAAILVSCTNSSKKGSSSTEETTGKTAYKLVKLWETDTVLLVPECVLYDKDRDVLYVSNLNFEPRLKDGNGFISKLSTSGEILDLSWIDGMSSPKGMALVSTKLYVTDVDELIEMDVEKGVITDRWTYEDAGMLNDIAADDDGTLYISDTDANTILRFRDGTFTVWLADGLAAPNGLLYEKDRLLLASMESHDLVAIDYNSKMIHVIADSIGRGDGIAWTGIPENYLVSDWMGHVYYIYPDGSQELLLEFNGEDMQTADITYMIDKKELLVPTFYGNRVIAYRLEKK